MLNPYAPALHIASISPSEILLIGLFNAKISLLSQTFPVTVYSYVSFPSKFEQLIIVWIY